MKKLLVKCGLMFSAIAGLMTIMAYRPGPDVLFIMLNLFK